MRVRGLLLTTIPTVFIMINYNDRGPQVCNEFQKQFNHAERSENEKS